MTDLEEKMQIEAAARARAMQIYNKPNHRIVGNYPTATVTSLKKGVAEGYITLLFENEPTVCKSYFKATNVNGAYVITITLDFND